MPSRVLKFDTPCQTLSKNFPLNRIIADIPLKVFGCSAYVHLPPHHQSKHDPKSVKCIFIGYSSYQKGGDLVNQQAEYQFWDVPVPDFGVPEPNFPLPPVPYQTDDPKSNPTGVTQGNIDSPIITDDITLWMISIGPIEREQDLVLSIPSKICVL
ncbi:hypothetical protein CK203_039264 [Vitis vinifera]|uniref:Retroviral polymerase SH3-like domain-containing protein n=1 Tax=Vitis vinifera TaxID=29760 RepID=A0A438HGN6_VITVI|nr:hypothetical protein CK203_039264 [Vitis vinifera]